MELPRARQNPQLTIYLQGRLGHFEKRSAVCMGGGFSLFLSLCELGIVSLCFLILWDCGGRWLPYLLLLMQNDEHLPRSLRSAVSLSAMKIRLFRHELRLWNILRNAAFLLSMDVLGMVWCNTYWESLWILITKISVIFDLTYSLWRWLMIKR